MWCGLIEGSTDEIHAHVLLIFFSLHHILAGTLPNRTRLTLPHALSALFFHTHFPNMIVFHTVLVSEHCPFMHPLIIFPSLTPVSLSHKFHINTLSHRPPIIILSCPLVNLSYKFHINTLLHRPPIIILSYTLLGINVPQTFVNGIPLHLANSILLHTHSTLHPNK